MSKEQEVLQSFYTKRTELTTAIEKLRLQLQQNSEILLRVEGAIEGFGLIGIEIDPTETPE